MVKDGEIEIACPGCGHKSVLQFSWLELEENFFCAGCAQSVAVETKEISKAIKQGQKALNETIRGLKRKPR